jgi:hypothetical protein
MPRKKRDPGWANYVEPEPPRSACTVAGSRAALTSHAQRLILALILAIMAAACVPLPCPGGGDWCHTCTPCGNGMG